MTGLSNCDWADGRRIERQPFEAGVQFRSGTRRASVTVHDLTRFGARVSGVFLTSVGERIWIRLPGIEPREARVIWVEDFDFGCEFALPLNEFVTEAIFRAA